MVNYGPLASDEGVASDIHELSTHVERDGQLEKRKENIQEYVLVSEQHNPRSSSIHSGLGHIRGRCVSSILLGSLAIFFTCCAITVGTLYHYSEIRHGLTDERDSHRYAWLYGPTAVVVLLRVAWRVVDLKVKQTTPWDELAHGPLAAKKSILLDYISPAMVPSLWRSLKAQHWPVLVTLTGQLMLLLMLVFVTGLFSLETTLVIQSAVPLRRTHFNATAFNASMLDGSAALLNLAVQIHNLSYPSGTTIDTVVPVFEAEVDQLRNATVDALVTGVEFSADCEVLNIQNASARQMPWLSIRAPQYLVNITTPSCNITNARVAAGPNHGAVTDQNRTQSFMGFMDDYVCNSGLDYGLPWGLNIGNFSNDTTYLKSFDRTLDVRMVVSLVDLHYVPGKQVADMPYMWVNNLTTLLCRPSYSLNQYRVSHETNSTTSHIELERRTNDVFPDLYFGDISKALRKVFHAWQSIFDVGAGGTDYNFAFDFQDRFLQFMTLLHGGEQNNFTLKDLQDPLVLKGSAESLIKGTITQAFHQGGMTGLELQTSDLIGNITFHADRLHVNALSTGILCACFSFMALFALALLFIAPHQPRLNSPIGSIGAIVEALRSNSDPDRFCPEALYGRTSAASKEMHYLTQQTSSSDHVQLECVDAPQRLEDNLKPDSASIQGEPISHGWWHSLASHTWYISVTIALCIVIIAILEWIQHVSDKRNGFMAIDPSSKRLTILSQYIPTAVVVGLTLMFADLEMLAATFSPLQRLIKGNANASSILMSDYLTRSGPHMFISAITNGHLGLLAILLATFVGSFLAILISTLYSHHSIVSVANATLSMTDRFNFTGVDISMDDKRAGAVFNLLTYYNIEYPKWTYDALAFPQLSLSSPKEGSNNYQDSSSTLTTNVSAYRSDLDCEPLPRLLNWTTNYMGLVNTTSLTATAYLPWSLCSNPPTNLSSNSTTPSATFSFEINNTAQVSESYHVIGKAQLLRWNYDSYMLYSGVGDDGSLTDAIWRMNMQQWGCPSLMMTMGSVSLKNKFTNGTISATTLEKEDLNPMLCTQRLQKVETDLTLTYPGMSIPKEVPPVVHEDTATWLQNPLDPNVGTAFQFAVSSMFVAVNSPNGTRSDAWAPDDIADRFVQAVAYVAEKEDGLTLQDLLGVKGSKAYLRVVQKVYGRYMAQAISSNMRVDIAADVPEPSSTKVPWSATASPTINLRPSPTPISRNRTTVTVSRGFPSQTANGTVRVAPTSTTADHTSLHPIPTAQTNAKRAVNPSSTLPANLKNFSQGAHVRLKQNRGPKIALQTMLAFMAICAIVSRLLTRTKEVLQSEPYSIAGRAALVANPILLKALNESHKVRNVKGGGGDGMRYRLDWWVDDNGRKRYGICIAT